MLSSRYVLAMSLTSRNTGINVKPSSPISTQLYLTVQPDSSIHVQPYHPLILPSSLSSDSLPYPIEIHPKIRLSDVYYEVTPSSTGNLLALLKSPMVLMMIFTAVMAFAAPKLLENLEVDPEDAKSVKDMRERFQNVGSTDWGEK